MQSLNSSDFTCDKCDTGFKYESRKAHWQVCGVFFTCPVPGCDTIPDHTFPSEAALIEHWFFKCPEIDLKCSVCKGAVKRSQVASHQCEANLLAKVELLMQRVNELEKENAELKAK